MLQVENLKKSFSGNPVFENVSFSMQKGEKYALLGRNGSGKTTLLKILIGEEEADGGTIFLPKGYKLGYLQQHTRFSCETVLEEAKHDLPEELQESEYEIKKVLFGLGFNQESIQKNPLSLSGGFQLRLKLAKVLCAKPNCFLLDEPTNYLDIVTMRWLERYLKNWNGECLIISHDRDFLDRIVNHCMGLHRQKLKKVSGDTERYFFALLEEEEIYEKTRINLEKKKEHAEAYIKRFGAKASKASQAQSRAKAIARMPTLAKLSSLADLDFAFQYHPFAGRKMGSAKNLSFSYQNDTPLIHNLSFEIEKGERIAIIGKNGMGKSTLLKLLTKQISPKDGSISLSEQLQMGYFGQTNIDHLHPDHTIEEEISSAAPTLPYTKIRNICGQMMFSGDLAKKKISVLSGGEKSRVLLGRILASPTNLLLLDEPTHHLDMESIEALIEAIDAFEGTVILVTHSEWVLERIAPDYLIVFHGDRQDVFRGPYEDFLEKQGWEDSPAKGVQKEKPSKAPNYLKPLQKEISLLEKSIETKELYLKEKESLLLQATLAGTSGDIHKFSVEIALLQKEIDDLYQKLETSYFSLEDKN